jgi:hypothetical protein
MLRTIFDRRVHTWPGQIDAIRIDGVVEFLDPIDDPTDGWFELDSVALY